MATYPDLGNGNIFCWWSLFISDQNCWYFSCTFYPNFSSRYLYRRNKKGITAKLDDDLLKFYCNEDTFLMQVTAIELEGMEGQDSIMYDITLCEIWDHSLLCSLWSERLLLL